MNEEMSTMIKKVEKVTRHRRRNKEMGKNKQGTRELKWKQEQYEMNKNKKVNQKQVNGKIHKNIET